MSYPDDLIEHMSDTGTRAAGNASAAASGEMAAVLSALDAHLGRDWSEASAAELHAELVALEQAQRRLRATQARVMAAARSSGTARQMGFVSERQMLTGGLGRACQMVCVS
ncbi:hypothetical protein AYJ66_10355 [Dietzia cinnamea]|nr:hypothetical protein AYJ66_10355 [Dietzia cinnamea]